MSSHHLYRYVIDSIIQCIKNNDIRMITHIMTYYDFISTLCMNALTLYALSMGKYFIAYLLKIYNENNHRYRSYYSVDVVYKPCIEGSIVAAVSWNLSVDFLAYDAAMMGSMECVKILMISDRNMYNIDEHVRIACYENGHVCFSRLLPAESVREMRPHYSLLNDGYINVARHCIENDIYIPYQFNHYYVELKVNPCIMLLLDHNLVDHRHFSREATKTLIKMGYIIKNKHSRFK